MSLLATSGLDTAIELLGWTCTKTAPGRGPRPRRCSRRHGRTARCWSARWGSGCSCTGPDSGTAIGSDHYVVVTGVENDVVRFHDPHGHPYATLPGGPRVSVRQLTACRRQLQATVAFFEQTQAPALARLRDKLAQVVAEQGDEARLAHA